MMRLELAEVLLEKRGRSRNTGAQPWHSKFDLVINLKTTKALGLTFPRSRSVLIRMNEVIR